jgi:hypothetical protein
MTQNLVTLNLTDARHVVVVYGTGHLKLSMRV